MNKLIQSLAVTGALLVSSMASAAITQFSDKYEGYTATSLTALSAAGYLYFNNVDTSGCVTDPDYGYGGGAPNDPGNPHMSAITTTEAGVNQGVQGLSIFSDYNNADHAASCVIETNIYREQTIDASNVGETWVFRFDYKSSVATPPGLSPSTTNVFIKTLDPGASFATTNLVTLDTTTAPDTWTEVIEISLAIDASLVGQIIQFGGSNIATDYNPSAIFYDNLCWFESTTAGAVCATDSSSGGGGGGLVAFSDDLEPYGIGPYTNELGANGWLHFNNVFDSGGTPKFGYGPFDAPSAGPQISAIVNGEGGVPQGDNQLSVYSDYDCCGLGGGSPEGHGNGTDLVETNVFQEQIIGAADVGTTWQMAFDAKLGNLVTDSTALAFIKTLDPNNSFALVDFVTVDLTATPATWTNYSISHPISAGDVGYILQFGFSNTASNFTPSGVFYDNISWAQAVGCVGNGTDTDGDGIDDNCDNCSAVANAGQEDYDMDGHGTACDGDFNNDCDTNGLDIGPFKGAFFTTDPDSAEYDLNNDGSVNGLDIGPFKALFFLTPGPSGADQVPAPLCP